MVNSGLLLMAVMGLMFPAVLHFTRSEVQYGKSEMFLSRFSSCVMLIAYGSYLFFQLKSQRGLYDPVGDVSSLFPPAPPARRIALRKNEEASPPQSRSNDSNLRRDRKRELIRRMKRMKTMNRSYPSGKR